MIWDCGLERGAVAVFGKTARRLRFGSVGQAPLAMSPKFPVVSEALGEE